MKKILVLGAGRSSAHLVRYLIEHAGQRAWHLRLGDMDLAHARARTGDSPYASAFAFSADDAALRRREITDADLVVSMLPAFMHPEVARDCVEIGRPLITPSYVSEEMWKLDEAARQKGVILLNEMGVDPGIDHMSAMQIIDEIRGAGGRLESFESFTGGLIAPESDNNPWNYKITWNPRNVVLAGYGGTARYRENGGQKFIPYHRLFERITAVDIEGHGRFEGYANRDSMKYHQIYGLEDIPTLYRGTLRKSGFCAAWNALVQIGLTDDSFHIAGPDTMTWSQLTASFLPTGWDNDPRRGVKNLFSFSQEVMDKLEWLGIFSDRPLGIASGSPAVALQALIEERWKLSEGDKDMIVMWHRFRYSDAAGRRRERTSALVVEGEDPVFTAMSMTVGLPIAIAAGRILSGELATPGVLLPITADIYEPVLHELASDFGIRFVETDKEIV